MPDVNENSHVYAGRCKCAMCAYVPQDVRAAQPPKAGAEVDWLLYPDNIPKLYCGLDVSHPLMFVTENEEGTNIRLGAYYAQPRGFVESGDPKNVVYTSYSVRSFYEYPFPPKGLSITPATPASGKENGDAKRCPICDWSIVPQGEAGCWEGNCSYRPSEGTDEYRRIEKRLSALKLSADSVTELLAEMEKIKFDSTATGMQEGFNFGIDRCIALVKRWAGVE